MFIQSPKKKKKKKSLYLSSLIDRLVMGGPWTQLKTLFGGPQSHASEKGWIATPSIKMDNAGPNQLLWHSPFVMVAIVLTPFPFHASDINVIILRL